MIMGYVTCRDLSQNFRLSESKENKILSVFFRIRRETSQNLNSGAIYEPGMNAELSLAV